MKWADANGELVPPRKIRILKESYKIVERDMDESLCR